jgi:hypothetical protein
MLTKVVGVGTVLTMSATAQSFTATTFLSGEVLGIPNQHLPALKVRIATSAQPAYVAIGTTATAVTGILIPANVAEHYKLDATNMVSVLQAGTGGVISITPVA